MRISNQIYKNVADNLNVDEKLVRFTINAYYSKIKSIINEIPIDYKTADEDYLRKNRLSFILPGIGKLYCSMKLIKSYRKTIKYKMKNRESDKFKNKLNNRLKNRLKNKQNYDNNK